MSTHTVEIEDFSKLRFANEFQLVFKKHKTTRKEKKSHTAIDFTDHQNNQYYFNSWAFAYPKSVQFDPIQFVMSGPESAYNRSVKMSTGLSTFYINYGYDPRSPIELTPVLISKKNSAKAEDFKTQLMDIHEQTRQNLKESDAKYKAAADEKKRHVEIQVGNLVWAVLTIIRTDSPLVTKISWQ